MLKHILVIGGCPYESIDGVRHYANHGRPRWHGHTVAHQLQASDTQITLLHTPSLYHYDADIHHTDIAKGKLITNTQSLLEAAVELIKNKNYDGVLQLANIPAITPAMQSLQKLKVKKTVDSDEAVALDIVGNMNIETTLISQKDGICYAGYDQHQKWFAHGKPEVTEALQDIVSQALLLHAPAFAAEKAKPSPMTNELAGRKIVITSGPTVEFISSHGDCISNFSSGKQGYAIAHALADMGAHVVLVSGPVQLPAPAHPNIITQYVESTQQMHAAVMLQLPADAYIGVAAVADFYVKTPGSLDLPAGEKGILKMAQNPDILHSVATHTDKRPTIVVGFAAETNDLQTYARDKLERKKADVICANEASVASGDTNRITWITKQDTQTWQPMSKAATGRQLGLSLAAMLTGK